MEEVNPYNAKKEWDGEGQTGISFVSADDAMAYVSKPKTVVIDTVKSDEPEEDVIVKDPAEEVVQPFTKTDWKKRHDDLRTWKNRTDAEHKQEITQLKAELQTNRPKYIPPKTPDELATFKKEYPDIYSVVETVSHMTTTEEVDGLKEQVTTLQDNLGKITSEKALVELKSLVPDFDSIRVSDDFQDWAKMQPEQIQDWVFRNGTNAQLAARAINLYKMEREMIDATTKTVQEDTRGTAADAVSLTGKVEEPTSKDKTWSESEIEALSIQQYEQHAAEIDKAYQDGRVVRG